MQRYNLRNRIPSGNANGQPSIDSTTDNRPQQARSAQQPTTTGRGSGTGSGSSGSRSSSQQNSHQQQEQQQHHQHQQLFRMPSSLLPQRSRSQMTETSVDSAATSSTQNGTDTDGGYPDHPASSHSAASTSYSIDEDHQSGDVGPEHTVGGEDEEDEEDEDDDDDDGEGQNNSSSLALTPFPPRSYLSSLGLPLPSPRGVAAGRASLSGRGGRISAGDSSGTAMMISVSGSARKRRDRNRRGGSLGGGRLSGGFSPMGRDLSLRDILLMGRGKGIGAGGAAGQEAEDGTKEMLDGLDLDEIDISHDQGSTSKVGEVDREGEREETEDELEEDEDGGGDEDMVYRMRCWRNDAMTQHLYSTAQFWGGKVWNKTRNPNDAFWLAQVYFLTHQYARAEKILTSPHSSHPHSLPSTNRTTKSPSQQRFNGDVSRAGSERYDDRDPGTGKGKGKGKIGQSNVEERRSGKGESGTMDAEDDNSIENLINGGIRDEFGNTRASSRTSKTSTLVPPLPNKSTLQANKTNGAGLGAVGAAGEPVRLVDQSVACRYLAAQCQVRLGKWEDALDTLGEENPFRGGKSGPTVKNTDGGIKFEATMCHLRGLIHLHLNSTDKAKRCFLEALELDVKCYESFEALVEGNMLTVDEEWEFIQGLAYREQTEEDAEFIRMMYTVRLKKYKHQDEMKTCRERLTEDYGMGDDPDVLFGLADQLYASMKWAQCYKVTSQILALHDGHAPTLPIHLACMHHLPQLRSKLFLLAHEMVEREPDSAVSWYAVGLWYHAGSRWEESRKFFAKAALLDPRFGPTWIAYAHSFALEGEHDQAITAYSTAQRHFQGTHLPLLFIGMQHLQLHNVKLAEAHVEAAFTMCQTDPLLWNERGVVAYQKQEYEKAVDYFNIAIELAESVQSSTTPWIPTHLNLGHAHRKIGNFEQARYFYQYVVDLDPRSAPAYTSLGLVEHMLGNMDTAISHYHEALAVSPVDPITSELLKLCVEHFASTQFTLSAISSAKTLSMVPPRLKPRPTESSISSNLHYDLPVPGLNPSVLDRIDKGVRGAERAGWTYVRVVKDEEEGAAGDRSTQSGAGGSRRASQADDSGEMSLDQYQDPGEEGDGVAPGRTSISMGEASMDLTM